MSKLHFLAYNLSVAGYHCIVNNNVIYITNMKNILIGLLVVAVLVEGYMLWMKKSSPAKVAGVQTQMSPRPSGGPAGGRAPAPPLAKGD